MEMVAANCDEKPFLLQCPLSHIYYWWQLAGGDVNAELKNEGLIRSEAPILTMPRFLFLFFTFLIYMPANSVTKNILFSFQPSTVEWKTDLSTEKLFAGQSNRNA